MFFFQNVKRLHSNEYYGLNLSKPPVLTWASSAEALKAVKAKEFDLVITMPRVDGMSPDILGRSIKEIRNIPVFLLLHDTAAIAADLNSENEDCIDKRFVWRGNTDLLLALVKMAEDEMNVETDTAKANVRVIIVVEDSPLYISSIRPLLYKEIVRQTQAVIE